MILGKDHLCPKFLSTVTKKRKVPIWPILILAVLNVILVNLDFEILVIILSPLLFVCYVGFAIAFLKLRKLYPVEKRGDLYYVKGKISPYYIVISMMFIGLVGILMNGTEYLPSRICSYPVCSADVYHLQEGIRRTCCGKPSAVSDKS